MTLNMNAVEAILARRSERSVVESSSIDDHLVAVVVECGMAAPSSKNAQPWRLHVVSERNGLGSIADAMVAHENADRFVPLDPETGRKREDLQSTVVESAATLRSCSVGIFVENTGAFSRSRKTVAAAPRELLEDALIGYSLEIIGLGAAIENMWIAATSLGLSASFMGDVLVAEETVKRQLGMSGDLVGVLALRAASG
jgi:nitroreductase